LNVTSLGRGTQKTLIARLDAGNVAYAQGHLLFMQNHTLKRVRNGTRQTSVRP
jgi:hypothetical protein